MAGKYRSKGSKTSLFLIELIISVFFFSLACVVCVRLFLYASGISRDASDLSHAVRIAQNAAESFLGAEGDPEEASLLFLYSMDAPSEIYTAFEDSLRTGKEPGSLLLSFDKEWNLTEAAAGTGAKAQGSYYILLDYSGDDTERYAEGELSRLRIEAGRTSPASVLYELPVAYYTGQRPALQAQEIGEDTPAAEDPLK